MYKIYIGCLPASCTKEELVGYFSYFGPTISVKIVKRARNKLCSGNAILECGTEYMFNAIVAQREFDFHDRRIYCEPVLQGRLLEKKNRELSLRRIYISNLPSGVSNDQLQEQFKLFGPVQNAYRIRTLHNEDRPFGFVTFHSQRSASLAVSTGSLIINGRKILILRFKKNEKIIHYNISNDQDSIASKNLQTTHQSFPTKLGELDKSERLLSSPTDLTRVSSTQYHSTKLNHTEHNLRWNLLVGAKSIHPLPDQTSQ